MLPYLLEHLGKHPLIVKMQNSTQGIGVIKTENAINTETIVEALNKLREKIIIQEFIKEAKGEDIRVFIVDGEVIATMRRQAREGEFRSNLHRGATSQIIHIEPEEAELALRAVKILGLKVAGVDILRSQRGPLILEVNASPGLEGIEGTTGIDIANEIILFVEREVRRQAPIR